MDVCERWSNTSSGHTPSASVMGHPGTTLSSRAVQADRSTITKYIPYEKMTA